VIVVPSNYSSFFDAASQAAGALIGLLFVVIALKPGKIVGPHAEPTSRRLAASSFTGLVNAFFVSLLALIPGHNIGIGAAIVAAFSLYHTLRLHLGHPGVRHVVVFVISVLAYTTELCLAIAFVLHPHDVDLVTDLTFVLIGCFSVALSRAWQLMESTAVGMEGVSPADTPGDDTERTEHGSRPSSLAGSPHDRNGRRTVRL
jgi:hypothetical protein